MALWLKLIRWAYIVSSIGKSTAPVSQRSRVRIPYKPEFFSGFLFATAKVASITAMIYFYIFLHPAVQIYDFHIFTTSSPSFHGFITNQLNDLLLVGLVALRLSFRNCKSCVCNCGDLLSHISSPRSSQIWYSYIHNFKYYIVTIKN